MISPWSNYWDRNYFVQMLPFAGTVLRADATRAAICGVGVLTMFAGLAEIRGVFSRLHGGGAASDRSEP
jgi:hypothetical protein